METRRLRYFLQIADAGSISRAAAALGVAQPALSQQLAVLENEVKTRLFERSPSGVVLTEAGRALYVRAQLILRQVEGLDRDLQAHQNMIAGPAALGMLPSLGHPLGAEIVARTHAAHPAIRLQMVEAPAHILVEQLLNGLLDIILAPVQPASDKVAAEPLFQEEMILVTAPGAPEPPSDLTQLAALPWVVPRTPNAIRGVMGAAFAQSGLEPNVVAEIDSLPIVIDCVAAGLGVSLLPSLAIREALAHGRLKAWPEAHAPTSRTINLCRRTDEELSPAVEALVGVLRAVAADHGARHR